MWNAELSREMLMVLAAGVLAFAIWCAAGLWWIIRREAHRRWLDERLGLAEAEGGGSGARVLRLWRDGEESSTVVPHMTRLSLWLIQLRARPHEAGWKLSIELIFLILSGVMLVVFLGTFLVTGSFIASIGLPLLMAGGFWTFMNRKIQSRHARFDKGFEDALSLIARSLRAGQPLLGAFQLVAEEMEAPVSDAFHEVCQQQALGVSLEEAIRRVAENSSSEDFKLFSTSVIIQLRTGGNLADMMQRLAAIMRERLRLARRVTILTAQTQFSKRVLLVLPFIIIIMLSGINRTYMDPLFTTEIGRWMTVAAILMLAVGSWVMNRMAQPRY